MAWGADATTEDNENSNDDWTTKTWSSRTFNLDQDRLMVHSTRQREGKTSAPPDTRPSKTIIADPEFHPNSKL